MGKISEISERISTVTFLLGHHHPPTSVLEAEEALVGGAARGGPVVELSKAGGAQTRLSIAVIDGYAYRLVLTVW